MEKLKQSSLSGNFGVTLKKKKHNENPPGEVISAEPLLSFSTRGILSIEVKTEKNTAWHVTKKLCQETYYYKPLTFETPSRNVK